MNQTTTAFQLPATARLAWTMRAIVHSETSTGFALREGTRVANVPEGRMGEQPAEAA